MSSLQLEGEAFLSPRSRVAKMLADIDNGIENGSIPLQDSPQEANYNQKTSSTNEQHSSPAKGASVRNPFAEDNDYTTENDEDEDDIIRPRGRAANRMIGNSSYAFPTPSRKRPADAMLSSTKTYKLASSRASRLFDNEEDDLYSATPIASRRHSPMGSVSSSNGLFVTPTKDIERDHETQESDHDLPSNPFSGTNRLSKLVAQKKAERLAREAELNRVRQQGRDAHGIDVEPTSQMPIDAMENTQQRPDMEIERIMSDATRPTRKASKKALLEMERETQRLARQQALAHRMEVKKKFTTKDLFAKFNYRASAVDPLMSTNETVASSAPNSDGTQLLSDDSMPASVRRLQVHSTPPSSPPSPLDREREKVEQGALSKLMPVREDTLESLIEEDSDEELPDPKAILEAPLTKSNPITFEAATGAEQIPNSPKSQIRVSKIARWGQNALTNLPQGNDSDDDLEVEAPLPRHLKAFQNARGTRTGKTADSSALHHLRYLSSIGTDSYHAGRGKPRAQKTITATALQAKLRKRALIQARYAQEERLAELRAKGITIQTVEEREREAEEFENLLEKARQDAVDLRRAEKAARKEANAQNDGLGNGIASSDESEDGDYEVSGSEEEGGDGTIEGEAEESSDGETELGEEESREEPQADVEEGSHLVAGAKSTLDPSRSLLIPSPSPKARKRATRMARVIADDEDTSDSEQPNTTTSDEVIVENQNEDPFAAFNFGSGNAGDLMSPTQAFNATMQMPTQLTQEDSMDIFGQYAPPLSVSSLPPTLSAALESQFDSMPSEDIARDSQVAESQRVDLVLAAPETPVPATVRRDESIVSALETPGWELSQDRGLPSPWIGVRGQAGPNFFKDVEHETQSTVRLRISESPAPSSSQTQHTQPRRGRLTKRQRVASEAFESDDEMDGIPASALAEKRDAFATMAKKRREALTAAERVEAAKEMHEMMDEQAEESEDEYAGLGGDEFVAPETAEDHEMIDSSHVDVDERALAAHHAERERIRMEQETNKLFKDLTTGALRRRGAAGGDWELEEDEDEVAARRRQMRLREEARKRKLLLQDESLAGLAEGKPSKGKDAFLKAIADADDAESDGGELSDDGVEQAVTEEDSQHSQQQAQQSQPLPLTETTGNALKYPQPDLEKDSIQYAKPEDRPPAKQRRTKVDNIFDISKRPTSILEVRESLSFLLEEPSGPTELAGPTAVELSDASSDDEYDGPLSQQEREDEATAALAQEEARANDGGFAVPDPPSDTLRMPPPPRPPAAERRTKLSTTVIDRLSLRRNASSSSNSSVGSDSASRSAWATTSTNASRVPSLLRRATTSSATANDRGVTTSNTFSARSSSAAAAASAGGKIIKAASGGGRSSLAAQARDEEKKAIVEASTRRRAENTRKIAELRRAATVGSGNNGGLARGLGGYSGFE